MNSRKSRKPVPPLDQERLRALALRYVERYATTRAKLAAYLARKLRERGWKGEGAPDIEALTARFAELGYVDDRLYGEGKARSLAARGYGARRVGEALRHAGLDAPLRDELTESVDARAALTAYARRRRFGPFAAEKPDRDAEAKQFAAMLRAGHPIELVRALLGAHSAETFLDEA